MRLLLVTAVAIVLAGCAPANMARSSCESHPLTVADEWTCTVKGALVGTTNSIRFSTDSRNQIAQVKVAVQVTKGTLRLTYADLTGSQHLLVTPSEPAAFSFKTRLSRDDRSFTIMYEPFNGPVEGLTGTVDYSTP